MAETEDIGVQQLGDGVHAFRQARVGADEKCVAVIRYPAQLGVHPPAFSD